MNLAKDARKIVALVHLATAGCSTSYQVSLADLDALKGGNSVANVKSSAGEPLELGNFTFDYRTPSAERPQRIAGIESLNRTIETGGLAKATELWVVPQRDDRAWHRVALGGGLGLLAGFGVGYAVTNRIALERQARDPAGCSGCTIGTVFLGAGLSSVVGAALGGLVSYFGAAGVGDTQPAVLELLPREATASAPTSAPASAPSRAAGFDATGVDAPASLPQ